MNVDIKQQWLRALRGGKYQQGHGKLRHTDDSGDKYCCLGVLCDLVDPTGWKPPGTNSAGYYHKEASGYPSAEVRAIAELASDDENTLVALNDGRRASFLEIAKYIEEHL